MREVWEDILTAIFAILGLSAAVTVVGIIRWLALSAAWKRRFAQ